MKRTVRDLKRGSIFYVDGQRFKLVYRNVCRAYVETQVSVNLRGRAFRAKEFWNIAPGTICEVRR